MKQLEGKDEVYDDLREEIENYREYVQKESERLSSQVNIFLICLSILVPSLVAIRVWLFNHIVGQSKKEVEDSIDKKLTKVQKGGESKFQEQLTNTYNEAKQRFKDQLKDTHTKAEQEFKRIVDQEVSVLNGKINTLKRKFILPMNKQRKIFNRLEFVASCLTNM